MIKLLKAKAVTRETARPRSELQLTPHEADTIKGLVNAGLIFDVNGALYLTQLGTQAAQGASKIWNSDNSQSVDQAISTAKVALNLINQEIRRLKGQMPK